MKRRVYASNLDSDKIQQLQNTLKRQGIDISDEYDIIYGLMQMGHSRTYAVKLMKQIIQQPSEKAAGIDAAAYEDTEQEPLTIEGFYEMFSVACEPDIMDEAAQILYDWCSEEYEEFMPEYLDILDMCDAATDDHEKYTVLYALGEIDEDEYYLNA